MTMWRRLDLIRHRPMHILSAHIDPYRVPTTFDVRPGEHVWPFLAAYRWCPGDGPPCDTGRRSADLLHATAAHACLYCGQVWDITCTDPTGCPGGVR